MQIDWQRAINNILSNKISCPRCGTMEEEMLIGYMRTREAVEWAPLCQGCSKRDSCDTRKLVALCQRCATSVRLRGRRVDEEHLMLALMDDCRRLLEEALDYLGEYWREDLDIDLDDMDKRLEDVNPELFSEEDNWRRYLEEQYLKLHRWLRERSIAVPNPGWRSEYVEEVIGLGYSSLLGN